MVMPSEYRLPFKERELLIGSFIFRRDLCWRLASVRVHGQRPFLIILVILVGVLGVKDSLALLGAPRP